MTIMPRIKLDKSTQKGVALFVAAMLLGLGLGYGLKGRPEQPGASIPPSAQPAAARIEGAENPDQSASPATGIYVCPMNCVPPMEKPGKCPVCGMDLVAASAQEYRAEENRPRVTLADKTIEAAGIQVAPVEKKAVTAEIRLFGKIEYDPVHEYKVTAFAPGVIDKIYVKRAGQTVRAGDALFDLHSSELSFLEQELFETLAKLPYFLDSRPARGQRFKRWVRPWMSPAQPAKPGKESEISKEEEEAIMAELSRIRRKMRLLGLAETDIDRIIARGSPTGISTVTTPMGGIVLEQYAFKGTYLNTGDAVFTIANPQYVWAKFDAYASDFPWIKLGQEAEFRSDAYPGEIFKGKVIYLDPYFDEKTRTFKVGVLCTDHKGKLKPAMLVLGVIYATLSSGYRVDVNRSEAQKTMLVVPDTAPLITGKRAVVYVEVPEKPGTYEGREVFLGPRAKGYYVVRGGLHEGEKVVVNGSFKIDSAIQILAKPSMMEGRHGGKPETGQMLHGGAHGMPMAPAVGTPAVTGPQDQRESEGMQRHDPRDMRLKRMEEIRRAVRDGRARAPSTSREKGGER